MDKRQSFWRSPYFLVNVSGFLDLFGVSLILPILTPHVYNLGASSTLAGIFGSTYGALQLFSSPIVGKWSDLVGRRVSLLVCLVSTGLGYGLMGLSASLLLMFLARIPGGIFKHSQNISKSYLADITSKDKRSHVFGQFNSASSIGFVIGPTVGGMLAERPGGFTYVGLLAFAVFLLNAALMWMYLPSSTSSPHPEISREDSVTSLKKLASAEYSSSFKELFKSFHSIDVTKLWDLFLIKFLLGFSVIIFRSNFSLMTVKQFDMSPSIRGYLTSYTGAVSTICGFFVGKLAKSYDDDGKLFFHMTVLQLVTLFALTVSPNVVWLAVWLAPLSVVTTVMRVVATTLTIHRGEEEDRGALMGFSQSLMSVARMIAPFVGGVAMETSPRGPVMIGTIVTLLALCILIVRPQHDTKMKTS